MFSSEAVSLLIKLYTVLVKNYHFLGFLLDHTLRALLRNPKGLCVGGGNTPKMWANIDVNLWPTLCRCRIECFAKFVEILSTIANIRARIYYLYNKDFKNTLLKTCSRDQDPWSRDSISA